MTKTNEEWPAAGESYDAMDDGPVEVSPEDEAALYDAALAVATEAGF